MAQVVMDQVVMAQVVMAQVVIENRNDQASKFDGKSPMSFSDPSTARNDWSLLRGYTLRLPTHAWLYCMAPKDGIQRSTQHWTRRVNI